MLYVNDIYPFRHVKAQEGFFVICHYQKITYVCTYEGMML
jgi:hypothetical protein